MKIGILIGHGKGNNGGYDPGACAQGFEEFKIGREVGKYAVNALRRYDCGVELVNYEGTMNLKDRIAYCNSGSDDLIIECHLNAGKGTGCEVYHAARDAEGRKLAAAVSKGIAASLLIPDRGARTKLTSGGADYFGVIRETKARALLVETCFIDSGDVYKVRDMAGQRMAGESLATAVANVLGLKKKEDNKMLKAGNFSSSMEAAALQYFLTRRGYACELVPSGEEWAVAVMKAPKGKSLADAQKGLSMLGCYSE